jgi:hypothetical protein
MSMKCNTVSICGIVEVSICGIQSQFATGWGDSESIDSLDSANDSDLEAIEKLDSRENLKKFMPLIIDLHTGRFKNLDVSRGWAAANGIRNEYLKAQNITQLLLLVLAKSVLHHNSIRLN